jgi:hypothetical protein
MNYRDYREYISGRRGRGFRNSGPIRAREDHFRRDSRPGGYYGESEEGMDHGYGARPTPRNGYYPEGYYYDPDRFNESGRHDSYDSRSRSYFDHEDAGRRGQPRYNYYESYPSYGQSAPYGDHERSWSGRDPQDTEYRYSDEDRHNEDYRTDSRRRYHRNRY